MEKLEIQFNPSDYKVKVRKTTPRQLILDEIRSWISVSYPRICGMVRGWPEEMIKASWEDCRGSENKRIAWYYWRKKFLSPQS